MVFGDGDREIFEDFTRAPDVVAHELTHGVMQYTAQLPYDMQPGALNGEYNQRGAIMSVLELTDAESLSDVFGSMVKQWRGGVEPQVASDADWLIGQGIFNPDTGIVAIRSMKHPGTAYDNDLIGKDPQVAHMDDYADLPDDEGSDVSAQPNLTDGFL